MTDKQAPGMTKLLPLHVVALSGGKDSTAMALRLRELMPDTDFIYICTPTGDELPEMFEHWRKLGDLLGKKIQPIMAATLNGEVARQDAIPNWRQRWCTRILKIEPYAKWLSAQTEKYSEVFSYVGLRADEPEREGGDYAAIPGVNMIFPMRGWGWGLSDVLGYLKDRSITIPKRTDCARCFYQRLSEWWALWREHPEIWADIEAQEAAVGHTWRSPGRDTWPAGLAELRKEFEAGRIPRGADRQDDMFANMKCRVCRI